MGDGTERAAKADVVAGVNAATTCLVVHPGAELYGSDRVLIESVSGLMAAGMHVTVLLPTDGPLAFLLRETGASVQFAPLLVLRKTLMTPRGLPSLFVGAIRDAIAATRTIGRIRPDAVYVNTVTLPIWPVISWLRRVPTLVHVHEAERSARTVVKRLLYAPLACARAIVVNSAYSRDVIADVYPRMARRAEIVYNGVPGPSGPVPPRERLEEPVRLVYVGRLSPRKGPDLLVEAARSLAAGGTRVRVDLIGAVFPGYEWFEKELRGAADEAGCDVRLRGFHEEMWPFLTAADIAVVPSRLDEPFGNTAVEAVLAGRPVVVSDTSGLREAVAGVASAVTVPPNNAVAIENAIRRIMDDWEGFRRGAADAVQPAHERFAPDAYRARTTEVVSRLVEGHRNRRRMRPRRLS
tara:strand:+ start:12998 stop:14224 length:1227 start_codon:yes stop_codon:yes gene_type:complete